MTFYHQQITRIKKSCYANDVQLTTVITVRRFINDHLDQELDLTRLSQIGFTSKFHLLRLFKKYYGHTPQAYLTEKRIEQSKAFLKEGMSVSAACFAVGMQSPKSFSTLFKSRTGVSPTAFQKKQLSQPLLQ